jgi:hypothetical protein
VSAPKAYRQWLARRVRPLLRVHGLDGRDEEEPVRARPVNPGARAAATAASVRVTGAASQPARLF